MTSLYKRATLGRFPSPRPHGDMGLWSCDNEDWIVHRRAWGRRRYNAQRRRLAQTRRKRVECLMLGGLGLFGTRGQKSAIARLLGVHRSTITRDWQAVQAAYFAGEGA